MRLALVFPGQGAQQVGMGADLARSHPAARDLFERADAALGEQLSALCANGPEERLRETINAQPALVVTSIAALAALEAECGKPLPVALAAGHSVGEYAALVAVGALRFEDAVLAVHRRGELMQRSGAALPGTMAAVLGLTDKQVEHCCREVGPEVVVGNYNCPGQVVVSGSATAVAAVAERCRAAGARRVVPLAVSGAFHSPLMASAAQTFAAIVDELQIDEPQAPIVGNVTGDVIETAADVRAELRQQLGSPVRWTDSVRTMARAGITHCVELGPGQVLRGLISRTEPSIHVRSVGDVGSVREAAVWLREHV